MTSKDKLAQAIRLLTEVLNGVPDVPSNTMDLELLANTHFSRLVFASQMNAPSVVVATELMMLQFRISMFESSRPHPLKVQANRSSPETPVPVRSIWPSKPTKLVA